MSNRSKEKREKLLSFLSKIREEHNDDSSLIAINEIISELMEKKYGLVWEEHTERVDQEIIDKIPVFTEDKEKMISEAEDKDFNFLLEGDNLLIQPFG
jgi:adenine-specific DNA-methyltransferase